MMTAFLYKVVKVVGMRTRVRVIGDELQPGRGGFKDGILRTGQNGAPELYTLHTGRWWCRWTEGGSMVAWE